MEVKPVVLVKDRQTGQKGRYRMDQDRLLIGRDRTCFVVLESPIVSRKHAEIFFEGGRFFVKDLKSGNKTFLNETPLPSEQKTILQPGDLIRIGPYDLRFTLPRPGDQDPYEKTDSDILEIKMVKKLLKALDRENAPSLEIMEGPGQGQRCVLEGKSQEVVIGRDPACEFVIDSDVISRQHARLTRKWDAVQIEDMGSRNGVYVGRKRVKKKALKDGDRVHLGTVVLVFRNPQELALDLSPPQEEPPPKATPHPTPETPLEKEVSEKAPTGRAPAEQATEQKETSRVVELLLKWFPSPTEIAMGLLGIAVLVGALWALFQLF